MTEVKKSHSLEELTDQQLHCRIYGHNWSDDPIVDDTIGPMKVGRQRNTCDCGLVRSDILDTAGEVWSRSYDYSRSPGLQLSFATSRKDLRNERRHRQRTGYAHRGRERRR